MISEPEVATPPSVLDPQQPPLLPHPPRRPPLWRRRRIQVAALGVLVVVSIAVVSMSSRSTAAPPLAAAPTSTSLIAHGQIVPIQQAHVGTQAGGVVQQLSASPGTEVAAQTPLAWVLGPSGTEIVTAPFAGSVTNVLVHTGDTLMPGATIAVVADLSSLQVETSDVDEFLVSHVSLGQRVQVTVDALDNQAMTGTVTNVALLPQTATGGGQDYPVIVTLGGVPPRVRSGMSVRITLPE